VSTQVGKHIDLKGKPEPRRIRASGRGDRGYEKSETITIKLNCNTDEGHRRNHFVSAQPRPRDVAVIIAAQGRAIGEILVVVDAQISYPVGR
jgi:hypothetical protein